MDQALLAYFGANAPYVKQIQALYPRMFDEVITTELEPIPGVDPAWTTLYSGISHRPKTESGANASQRKGDLWVAWDIIPDASSTRILYSYTFKPNDPNSHYRPDTKKGKAELYATTDLFDVNESIYILPWKYTQIPEELEVPVTTLEPNRNARTETKIVNKRKILIIRATHESAPRGRIKMRNILLVLASMATNNEKWAHSMKYLSAAKNYCLNILKKSEPFFEFQNGDVRINADDCMCPIRISVLASAAYRSMNWGPLQWIEEVASFLFHNPYHNSLSVLKQVSSLLQGMTAYSPSQLPVSKRMTEILKKAKIKDTSVEKVPGETYQTTLPLLSVPLDWSKSYDVLTCDSVQGHYNYTITELAFSELNKENTNTYLELLLSCGLFEFAARWWLCLTSLPCKEIVQEGVKLHSVLEWAGYISEDLTLAHADTLSKGALDSSKQDLQVLRGEIDAIVKQYMDAMPRALMWTAAQFKQAIPRNMTNNSGGRGSFTISSVPGKFNKAPYIPRQLKDKYATLPGKSLSVASQSSKRAWWYLLGEDMIGETFDTYSKVITGIPVPHVTAARLERSKQSRAAYAVRVEETIPDFFFSYIANYVQSHSGTEDSTLAGWPYMINQSKGSMITDVPVFVKATNLAATSGDKVTRIIFSLDFTSWDLRLTVVDKIAVALNAFQFIFNSDPDYANAPFLWDDGKPYTYGTLISMAKAMMVGAQYTTVYMYHNFTFNASFMPSGKKFTLNFNSLINHAIAKYVFSKLGVEYGVTVINGRIQGDDNMWLVEITDVTIDMYNKLTARLVELCNSVGLEINVYKSVVRGNEFEFAKLYCLCGMIFQPLTVSIVKSEDPQGYVRTMEFFRALSGLCLIAATRGEDTEVHDAYIAATFAIRGSELIQERDFREFVFYPPVMIMVPKAYQGVGRSPVTDNADTLLMTADLMKTWVLSYSKELLLLLPDKGFAAQFGEAMAKNCMECLDLEFTVMSGGTKRIRLTLDWLDDVINEGGDLTTVKPIVKPKETAFIVTSGPYANYIPYVKGVEYAISTMDVGQLKLQVDSLKALKGKVRMPREYYYSNYWYLDVISAVAANDAVRKIDFESRKFTGRLLKNLAKRKKTVKRAATELKIADVLKIQYLDATSQTFEGASVFLAPVMGRLVEVMNRFGISSLSVPDQFATPLRALNNSTTFNGNVSISAIVSLVTRNLHVLFEKDRLVDMFIVIGAGQSIAADVASRLNIATLSTAIINTGYAYNGSLNSVLNMSPERLAIMVEGGEGAGDAFITRVRRLGQLVAAMGIATIKMYTGKDVIARIALDETEYGRYLDQSTNVRAIFGESTFQRLTTVLGYWAN